MLNHALLRLHSGEQNDAVRNILYIILILYLYVFRHRGQRPHVTSIVIAPSRRDTGPLIQGHKKERTSAAKASVNVDNTASHLHHVRTAALTRTSATRARPIPSAERAYPQPDRRTGYRAPLQPQRAAPPPPTARMVTQALD